MRYAVRWRESSVMTGAGGICRAALAGAGRIIVRMAQWFYAVERASGTTEVPSSVPAELCEPEGPEAVQ